MKRNILTTALAVAFITQFGTAIAQEADQTSQNDSSASESAVTDANESTESLLEEVYVTATRRTVNLQDVPLSITAFSQEQLTEKGIVNYEGIAFETPGAIVNRASANFNNFSVRGISTNGYGAGLQSTVAIYYDELPISSNGNSTILDPNLFDVERVEFLRGPQGTLFGSNSLAGAMRIITKRPELSAFDASVLVDLGMTGSDSLRQRYNGMVNIPLIEDTLGIRLVGFYRDEDGYVDNIGTGIENSNTLKDWGGRATMLWQPTDKLGISLMYMREDSEPEDSSLVNPNYGKYTRLSDKPDLFQAYLETYNATISYEFEGADLVSSSTWSTYDQDFIVDLAGTFGQTIAFGLDALAYDDAFVQELRLVSESGGMFEWTVGGYYNERRRDVDYGYRSNEEFLAQSGITGLDGVYYQKFGSHFISHELAGFGELTYNASDKLWFTGGIRYTKSDVQGFTEEGGFNSNYLTLALFGLPLPITRTPVVAATGLKGKESGPSYKFSVSYKPADNMTTYGTVSTGFRTPVVNARAGSVSTLDPDDLVIPAGADSDSLTNYEIGLKGNWFDQKLTGHLAAYYISWDDIQVQANRTSDTIQFATNIGGATSKGFEFELGLLPTPDLYLGINGSFNSSKVTDLTPEEAAISGAEKGVQLAFPEFMGSVFLRYTMDYGSGQTATFITNAQYVDGYPNQFPNAPGYPGVPVATYGETDSYTNVNMSLGTTLGDKWTLTGYVENMFDNDSYTYIHAEAFIDGRYATLRPRTYGMRLSYNY